ncbi:hypothetical protein [Streptomyces spiramenti]|uniref:hypothetical protein n=1 Tax=Streptomyces spiramenti TaxID=2720606 RepID=UPI001ADDDB93|nr:hypothetical protein [Streptomyces spiramenti]
MTADVVALEARKAAQAETEPAPDAQGLGQPPATVTSPVDSRRTAELDTPSPDG